MRRSVPLQEKLEKAQRVLKPRGSFAPPAVMIEGRRFLVAKGSVGMLGVESVEPDDVSRDGEPLYKGEPKYGSQGEQRGHVRQMVPMDLAYFHRASFAPLSVRALRAFLKASSGKVLVAGIVVEPAQLDKLLALVPSDAAEYGASGGSNLSIRAVGRPSWFVYLGTYREDGELPRFEGGVGRSVFRSL